MLKPEDNQMVEWQLDDDSQLWLGRNPQVMAEDHMISLVVVEPPTPLKNDGVKVNYGIHMFPKMWENMEKSSNSMVPVTTNQWLLVWNHPH